jgi:hypothetical protein
LEEHISSIFSVKEKAKKETASLGNQPWCWPERNSESKWKHYHHLLWAKRVSFFCSLERFLRLPCEMVPVWRKTVCMCRYEGVQWNKEQQAVGKLKMGGKYR